MRKGLKTKDKLVKAATDLFYKKGIQWVTFQQIAEKVGIAQPSMYKHFQDKDELIKECIFAAAQSGRALIDQNIDPHSPSRKQVFAYIEGNFLWLDKRPQEGAIILAMYYFGFNNPPIQKMMIEINNQSVERLAARLAGGSAATASLAPDIKVRARLIHDMLMGEVIKAIHQPKEMSCAKRVELFWSVVELMLPAKF